MKILLVSFLLVISQSLLAQSWIRNSEKNFNVFDSKDGLLVVRKDFIVKFNLQGDSLTSYNYSQFYSKNAKKYDVRSFQSKDGGYFLLLCYYGTTVIKLNTTFELEWTKEISSNCILDENNFIETVSGTIIFKIENDLKFYNSKGDSLKVENPQIWNIVANCENDGFAGLHFNKLSNVTEHGDTTWQKKLSNIPFTTYKSIIKLTDGYLILNDSMGIKVSRNGQIIQTIKKTFVKATNEKWVKGPLNGFLGFENNNQKQLLAGYDSLGQKMWEYIAPDTSNNFINIPSSIICSNNNIIIFGTCKDSSSCIIKLNNMGELIWKHTFNDILKPNAATGNLFATQGGYIGSLIYPEGNYSLFKISEGGIILSTGKENEKLRVKVTSAPNPFTNSINFSFSDYTIKKGKIILFNLIGYKVKEYQFVGNDFTLNGAELEKGMYLYQITDDQEIVKAGKIIKE